MDLWDAAVLLFVLALLGAAWVIVWSTSPAAWPFEDEDESD